MSLMQLFFILWMIVLPCLAIVFIIFIPIFWFFIVPRIARKLTWERFKKVSYHMVADDTGYAYLASTQEEVPEGVVITKHGPRFLPRPHSALGNPHNEDEEKLESLLLKKFVWKDTGKPLWFGYAGKVGAMNPATLAVLQQSQNVEPMGKPNIIIKEIEDYVKKLPRSIGVQGLFRRAKTWNVRKDLATKLNNLKQEINIQPYTILDPTRIKEIIPAMYTPSQLKAYGKNQQMIGQEKAGKQYTGLILGGALIIGLVILGIVLLVMLRPMLFPAPT